MIEMGIWTTLANEFVENITNALKIDTDVKEDMITWFNETGNQFLRESQKPPYLAYVTAYKKQHEGNSPTSDNIPSELMTALKEHAFQTIAAEFKRAFMNVIAIDFADTQSLLNSLIADAVAIHKIFSPIQSKVTTQIIQEQQRYKTKTGNNMTNEQISLYSQKLWEEKAEEYRQNPKISDLIQSHRRLQEKCRKEYGACGAGKNTAAGMSMFKQPKKVEDLNAPSKKTTEQRLSQGLKTVQP